VHRSQIVGIVEDELVLVLGEQWGGGTGNTLKHLVQIECFEEQVHAPSFDLREVKHVVDERKEVLARSIDLVEIGDDLVIALVLCILGQHLAVSDDRVHRRSQLVAHVRKEGALCLVCALGNFSREFQFLVRFV
jgi:hypothetical protein